MSEHKNAKFLRALAEGKTVQARNKYLHSGNWVNIESCYSAVLPLICGSNSDIEFRIATETISVTLPNGGVRIINAPLRKVPEHCTMVWYVNSQGDVTHQHFSIESSAHEKMGRRGLLFVTESDAKDWASLQREILEGKS